MTNPSECPSDRSELVSVIEDRADVALRTHVASCERCRLEIDTLQSTQELVSPPPEARPSDRVRREALSYARSQVRGPVHSRTAWRAPAVAGLGGVFAVFFGKLAEARLTSEVPQISIVDPWTLSLGAAWSLALFLYVLPGRPALRTELLATALAGATAFAVMVLAIPIPFAVDFCAAWVYGPGPLTAEETLRSYAVMASLYTAVPVLLVNYLRNTGPSWPQACATALALTVLAGPLLFGQALAEGAPSIAAPAGVAGMLCGACMAGCIRWPRRG